MGFALSIHSGLKSEAFLRGKSQVNVSPDQNHTIYTGHYPVPPIFLGNWLRREKTLAVEGSVGELAGHCNKGTLIIKGNALRYLGGENTGKIVVEGAAGYRAGDMNAGILLIHGCAGDELGYLNRGLIVVNGSVGKYAAGRNLGLIIVHGRASNRVGRENSGDVFLQDYMSISMAPGSGNIYAKGKCIVREGRGQ